MEPKLLRLTGYLNFTEKIAFEYAYTVTVNTFKETIDIFRSEQLMQPDLIND